MPVNLMQATKVVGAKQTFKALESGTVETIYIAKNADAQVVDPIIAIALTKSIPIVYVETMIELGRACKINVGAAVVSIIR